ncbi:MAG: type II secretion system F family protein [Phycisphaerae bacterium]|nr:type II secretion system F family protein [Phycisphaerae bacterium]
MNMLLIGVMAIIAVALVVYSLLPRKTNERDAVKRRLSGARGVDEAAEISQQARDSATSELVRKATPMLRRVIMPTSDEEQTNLRAKLASAGFRQPQAQTLFLGSKTVLGIAGVLAGILAAFSLGLQLSHAVGAVCLAAGLGFMLPNIWLGMAIGSRKEKLRHGLPDTLDLMVVSVESGLALDAALKRVGDEMAIVHPELSEEMRIATMEAQMGIPRGEALDNMARRTSVDEVRGLVSVIVQAEKFGTSIAKALRNQANVLRTKRQQAAEERAQKTAVKLLIPLILFIFPALGIVLGGPAVLSMLEALGENPSLAH